MVKVYTPEEAARILKVSKDAIYDLCARGMLPVARVGRRLRFSEEGLTEYLRTGGQGYGRKDALGRRIGGVTRREGRR